MTHPVAAFFDTNVELRPYAEFGFVFPSYRRRNGAEVRRVPTARATIYFARDVSLRPGGPLTSGMYCEGPHSRGFSVASESGELVAVKLAPGSLFALLGVPARELRDRTLPLDELWGKAANELADRMFCARTTRERRALLQRALVAQSHAHDRHDHVALIVSKIIERRGGQVAVSELCGRAGYGHRALLQRFDEWVGLTPKQYARLARFRAAVARLGAREPSSWADFAVAGGYWDQSHMIHDFTALVGVPPAAFRRDPRRFSPVGAPAAGRQVLPRREQQIYSTVGMVSGWLSSSNSAQNSG